MSLKKCAWKCVRAFSSDNCLVKDVIPLQHPSTWSDAQLSPSLVKPPLTQSPFWQHPQSCLDALSFHTLISTFSPHSSHPAPPPLQGLTEQILQIPHSYYTEAPLTGPCQAGAAPQNLVFCKAKPSGRSLPSQSHFLCQALHGDWMRGLCCWLHCCSHQEHK